MKWQLGTPLPPATVDTVRIIQFREGEGYQVLMLDTRLQQERVQAVADVVGKLGALGSSRQIAEYLAERGCHGVVGNPRHCPIANFIKDEFDGEVEVSVGSGTWSIQMEVDDGPGVVTVAVPWLEGGSLPDSVREFVGDFDSRVWPQLSRPDQL